MRLTIRQFNYKRFSLRFKKPITFRVNKNKKRDIYWLNCKKLNILYEWGHSFKELRENIKEHILVLWRCYAKEKDEKLSPRAIELKRQLHKTIYCVHK
jgi:hypothetical protein